MKHRLVFVLLLAATITLSACSPTESTSVPPSGSSGYVAIARGIVDVQGGMLSVYAPLNGTVSKVLIRDQVQVKAGQILFVLDATGAKANLAMAHAQLAEAQAKSAVIQAKLQPAARRAQRLAVAAAANAVATEQAETAAATLAQLRAQIRAAKASVQLARAGLDRARYRVSLYTVRAAIAGTVVRKRVQPGQRVTPQDAMPTLQILPARPLIVRAELNEAYVNAVHPGMRAQVVLAAGHGKLYPAHVLRVGLVFGPTQLGPRNDQPRDIRDIDCVLVLDTQGLRVGQRVLVKFLPQPKSSTPPPQTAG